ncbi:YpiF family protein [Bacillus sp. 1P06AnD]|uniref:YpiF family protein n=1 Tax=Bacillus sp. 1P06AnD TaxID=3132208 RepID=UPI0039A1223E
MKWTAKDVELYLNTKEYVDTAIIPLNGIDFQEQAIMSGSMHEYTAIIVQEVERQFKGRVLLLPPLTYSMEWDEVKKIHFFTEWLDTLKKQEIPFIFFITCDTEWKKVSAGMSDHLITVPLLPLDTMEDEYKQDLIGGQVKKVLNTIIDSWAN